MIFAPHPDDECVIGALPLRLKREAQARVISVAVTLGSNPERREARRVELSQACAVLGFELEELGFDGVTEATRQSNKEQWQAWCAQVAACILKYQPALIVVPHEADYHPAHIGTHRLVMDSLAGVKGSLPQVVLTEFWQAMASPNLMVECSDEDLAILLKALHCHTGEIQRNPYHLRLPAWMIDNTRRGTELVGGFGTGAGADFCFSTLYRALDAKGAQKPPLKIGQADIILPVLSLE